MESHAKVLWFESMHLLWQSALRQNTSPSLSSPSERKLFVPGLLSTTLLSKQPNDTCNVNTGRSPTYLTFITARIVATQLLWLIFFIYRRD